MGCTVCDSLDFHYFTSSNVGACFPPSDARARVTFRVSLQSWDGARKSASSVAPVNSGVYRERICEALLELLLLFYFIALLPLNPEERLKLSPSPGTVLATPNSPPNPSPPSKKHPKIGILFPGCLLNLELNCWACCISTCLQKARALQKNDKNKRKCRLLNFIPQSSFWRALDLLRASSGANAA